MKKARIIYKCPECRSILNPGNSPCGCGLELEFPKINWEAEYKTKVRHNQNVTVFPKGSRLNK